MNRLLFVLGIWIILIVFVSGLIWVIEVGMCKFFKKDKSKGLKKRIDRLKSNIDKDNNILYSDSFKISGLCLDLGTFEFSKEEFNISYSKTNDGNAISFIAVNDKKQYTFRSEDLERIILNGNTEDG